MAKQGREDRLKRLAKSQCPIHGACMPQDNHMIRDGVPVYVVECSRRACGIRGTQALPRGPVELLPQFKHLIDGN